MMIIFLIRNIEFFIFNTNQTRCKVRSAHVSCAYQNLFMFWCMILDEVFPAYMSFNLGEFERVERVDFLIIPESPIFISNITAQQK